MAHLQQQIALFCRNDLSIQAQVSIKEIYSIDIWTMTAEELKFIYISHL
jgi:hypothetical protein